MKEVHLFMKDNGSSIQADAGSTIIISLESNPGTGYAWALDTTDPNVIENISSDAKSPGATAIGTGINQYFTFKALKKGNCKISLKNKRQWEGDASAIKRFEIDVNVV